MMKPNRLTAYTRASRPMPSAQSRLKFEARPMVKNVMAKKRPRKGSVSAVAAVKPVRRSRPGQRQAQEREEQARNSRARNGERLQDVAHGHLLAGLRFDPVHPDQRQHQGPDADEDVDEDLHGGGRRQHPARPRRRPRTRRPGADQGVGDRPAGHGRAVGLDRQPHPGGGDQRLVPRGTAGAASGRSNSSTTEKTTTSDDTMIGTTGRARIAAPVVMAAETPQIEMPEASGAAHSRLKRKNFRAMKYTSAQ